MNRPIDVAAAAGRWQGTAPAIAIIRAALVSILALGIVNRGSIAAESPKSEPDVIVQPNHFFLGTVQTGSTVEASARVIVPGNDPSAIPTRMSLPPFLRLLTNGVGTQTYGTRGSMVFVDIEFAVDTRSSGRYSNVIEVVAGPHRVAIPIQFEVQPAAREVQPAAREQTRALIPQSPWAKLTTENGDDFLPWVAVAKAARRRADYFLVSQSTGVLRGADLSGYEVVLLAEEALTALPSAEMKSLQQFAARGGRVLIFANYFYRGTVAKANELMAPYGVVLLDSEPRSPTNLVTRAVQEVAGFLNLKVPAPDSHQYAMKSWAVAEHSLTKGVSRLRAFRPSPVQVTDPKLAQLIIQLPGYPGLGFAGIAHVGKGEMIAVGESLWWAWLTPARAQGSDNARLLQNLLAKPQGGR